MPRLQPLGVGHEQVVADELHLAAELRGQLLPAVPVVLGQAVLDRADRLLVAQLLPQVDHLVGRDDPVRVALEEAVARPCPCAWPPRTARCRRGRGRRRPARRACSRPSRRPWRWWPGPRRPTAMFGAKPPSSPTAVLRPLSCSTFLRLWNTSAPIRSASRNVGAPTGMIMNSWKSTVLSACLPPLRMFISGTGRTRGVGAAEVAVQRQAERRSPRRGRRPATRRGWRWPRACPCSACRRARAACWSIADLVEGVHARRAPGRSSSLTLRDGLERALAEVAVLVAVAQLDGLVGPGAGPARDGGPADGAVGQDDLDLDGRVAAAVEDFAGVDRAGCVSLLMVYCCG